jgi:hypothetical protein
MGQSTLPKFNMDNSATGCCPKFDPEPWKNQEFTFKDRLFVRAKTVSFLHIPLNIGSVFKRTFAQIQQAGAELRDEYLILSTDPSAWRGEHYFAVTKEVPGADNVRLSGNYLTKVFEGPFSDARKWCRETQEYVTSQGQQLRKLYFFYTTCPKCAKHYGKNYVVAFAEI